MEGGSLQRLSPLLFSWLSLQKKEPEEIKHQVSSVTKQPTTGTERSIGSNSQDAIRMHLGDGKMLIC